MLKWQKMEGVYADEQSAIRGKRLCVPWRRPSVRVAYAAVYLYWRVTVSFGNGCALLSVNAHIYS